MLKSAVENKRRTTVVWPTGTVQRLVPNLHGVPDALLTDQFIDQGNGLLHLGSWFPGRHLLPDGERGVGLMLSEEVIKRGQVIAVLVRQDLFQNRRKVACDLGAFRNGLGGKARIGSQGAAHLGEGFRVIPLSEQEVAVPPGDVRRNRMGRLRLPECFTRARGLTAGL